MRFIFKRNIPKQRPRSPQDKRTGDPLGTPRAALLLQHRTKATQCWDEPRHSDMSTPAGLAGGSGQTKAMLILSLHKMPSAYWGAGTLILLSSATVQQGALPSKLHPKQVSLHSQIKEALSDLSDRLELRTVTQSCQHVLVQIHSGCGQKVIVLISGDGLHINCKALQQHSPCIGKEGGVYGSIPHEVQKGDKG